MAGVRRPGDVKDGMTREFSTSRLEVQVWLKYPVAATERGPFLMEAARTTISHTPRWGGQMEGEARTSSASTRPGDQMVFRGAPLWSITKRFETKLTVCA